MKKTIMLLFGGESVEHDISIITAIQTKKSLEKNFDVKMVYIDRRGNFWCGDNFDDVKIYADFQSLAKKRKKVVPLFQQYFLFGRKKIKIYSCVNCCHGGLGEDGSIASFLQICHLPYTSSNPNSSQLTMDKTLTKLILQNANIQTCAYFVLNKFDSLKTQKKQFNQIAYPKIVKPANLGSSVGISVVQNLEEFEKAIEYAFEFDEKVLVEEFLEDSIELNCACYCVNDELFASSVFQVDKGKFFTFEEKYINETNQNQVKISPSVKKQIVSLTKKVYKLFNCFGIVRIDFLLKDGKIYVNELNSVPGGLCCHLFKKDFAQILFLVIEESQKRKDKDLMFETDFKSSALQVFEKIQSSGKLGKK